MPQRRNQTTGTLSSLLACGPGQSHGPGRANLTARPHAKALDWCAQKGRSQPPSTAAFPYLSTRKRITMGMDQLGKVALADRTAIREAGSRLSKGITDLLLAEVATGNLTVIECWLVLAGNLHAVGKRAGMGSASMVDHVRDSFKELDKLHGGIVL